jgi:hypothetical protein
LYIIDFQTDKRRTIYGVRKPILQMPIVGIIAYIYLYISIYVYLLM